MSPCVWPRGHRRRGCLRAPGPRRSRWSTARAGGDRPVHGHRRGAGGAGSPGGSAGLVELRPAPTGGHERGAAGRALLIRLRCNRRTAGLWACVLAHRPRQPTASRPGLPAAVLGHSRPASLLAASAGRPPAAAARGWLAAAAGALRGHPVAPAWPESNAASGVSADARRPSTTAVWPRTSLPHEGDLDAVASSMECSTTTLPRLPAVAQRGPMAGPLHRPEVQAAPIHFDHDRPGPGQRRAGGR